MLIALITSIVVFVGSLIIGLFGNLVRLVFRFRRPRWVVVTVKDPLPARPQGRRGWFAGPGPVSLAQLEVLVARLARDAHVQGVAFRLEAVPGGWARLATLRGVLARLRGAGKRVVVHLSSPSMREYLVATAGDTIVIDESGPLALIGIAAQASFFGGALAKVGARAEVAYRGKYKSFAETFAREDMSPAHREAMDAILDGLDAEARTMIASGRGVDAARAGELLTGGPFMPADAVSAGLADGVAYLDQLGAWLDEHKPAGAARVPKDLPDVGAWLRWAYRPLRIPHPFRKRQRRVRVLSLHGSIVGGEGRGWPREQLGSDAAIRALDAARRDPRVAAVVLHVDSPGGSAPASDLIWRAVVRLREQKPVVACFDDVAASGGYYLACAAHKIVAQPGTLTGSIGVVAGKMNLGGLLERLGVHTETLTRGPAAAMFSATRGFSDEERRRLEAEIEALYQQFVRKVAAGRGRSVEAIDLVAQGRVWTGADAHVHGLVDALGGVDTAIGLARELAELPQPAPGSLPSEGVEDARVAPRRRGLASRFFAGALAHAHDPLLGGAGAEPVADIVAEIVAELGWLTGFAHERVLLVPSIWLRWR